MKIFFWPLICLLLVSGCIKDDLIEDFTKPTLRITTMVDTIAIDSLFQFKAMYLNNVGIEESVNTTWSSSDSSVISIDENGLALAKKMGEKTFIKTSVNVDSLSLSDSIEVVVGTKTVITQSQKSGTVNTTSTYALSGDFTLSQEGNDVVLTFSENYNASTALPGLYIYLSNNKNVVTNGLEIGPVQVFSGVHSYTIPNIGIQDFGFVVYFCKPFNVKVGDGTII